MKPLSPIAAALARMQALTAATEPQRQQVQEQDRPFPTPKWLEYLVDGMVDPKKYAAAYDANGSRELISDTYAPKLNKSLAGKSFDTSRARSEATSWLASNLTEELTKGIYAAWKGVSKAQACAHVLAYYTCMPIIESMEAICGWSDENTIDAFDKLGRAMARNQSLWGSTNWKNRDEDRKAQFIAICLGIAETNNLAMIDTNDHIQKATQMEHNADEEVLGDTNEHGGKMDTTPSHSQVDATDGTLLNLIEQCIADGSADALAIAKNEARKMHNRADNTKMSAKDFTTLMTRIGKVEQVNRLEALLATNEENTNAIAELAELGQIERNEGQARLEQLQVEEQNIREKLKSLTAAAAPA